MGNNNGNKHKGQLELRNNESTKRKRLRWWERKGKENELTQRREGILYFSSQSVKSFKH